MKYLVNKEFRMGRYYQINKAGDVLEIDNGCVYDEFGVWLFDAESKVGNEFGVIIE